MFIRQNIMIIDVIIASCRFIIKIEGEIKHGKKAFKYKRILNIFGDEQEQARSGPSQWEDGIAFCKIGKICSL